MKKKKVLIIAGGLQIGGAERVAANISKYAPDDTFEFHYLVFDCNENVYGAEIEAKGGKLFTFPLPNKGYVSYIKRLNQLMRENHYTAVHSHTMFNSGINLAVAKANGIPIRIAHSHTTKTEKSVSAAQKLYEYAMQKCIVLSATHCFACGVEAGKWLFGKKVFERNGNVIRNGIDTVAFAWSAENRDKIRKQYNLQDAFIVGHTGTLVSVKNQKYLIELFPKILEKKPNAVLILIGSDEGCEQHSLETVAQCCGVTDRVIFTGPVLNVNEYLSAFDVFAFPSLREGTPLALLEAQANGVPCVVSKNVPTDAFLSDLIKTVSLDDPQEWVNSICAAQRKSPQRYANVIAQAGYDCKVAYSQIYNTYLGQETTKKVVISLSFDDGRGDNTAIVEKILFPSDIPVTLNITTGYIDGTCPPALCPSKKDPMRKVDIIRLAKHPLVEIALHGDQHQNTPEDILAGRSKLLEWLELDDNHMFGFASPGSALHSKVWNSSQYYELRSKLLYMRDSLRIENFRPVRILCRKIGRVIHLPVFYKIAYSDTKMYFRDGKIVYSACVLKDTTYQQVRALIDDCIKERASLTLMFHSIIDGCEQEDAWSWEQRKFEMLCNYLVQKRSEGTLEIQTTKKMLEMMQ